MSSESAPKYTKSVNQRPAFGLIGRIFGLKHQSVSFEKTVGTTTKVRNVSIGNPETEPVSKYSVQVRQELTREEYKAFKSAARIERDAYGKKHYYASDYLGFRGNCNDHVRKAHSDVGIPFPEGQSGLRNQSFYYQPPQSKESQDAYNEFRRWQNL